MKCWVVGCEDMHHVMWKDVDGLEDAAYVNGIFRDDSFLKNPIYKWLMECWKKDRLPAFVKERLFDCFTLSGLEYAEDMNYIILTDNRVGWYPMDYLKTLKKKHDIRYVLVYLNPYGVSGKEVLDFQKMTDIVFSYDRKDVEEHGFEPFITVYSAPDKVIAEREPQWDIVYFGGENGRLQELLDCFKVIDGSGVRYEFSIVGTEMARQKYRDKINYCRPLEYEEILEKESRSNVILEVLNRKQTGTTLRAMEAVVLNKKFISNNRRLVDMPFYDPRFMRVFTTPQEIDFDFVRKREDVHYDYKGECSPIRIIERIREIHDTQLREKINDQ